ncbi:MAG: hypothetical protein H7239_08775 [Flavobacterium sp.]|nr:hypothetical protein [Flavobacterium sp.]
MRKIFYLFVVSYIALSCTTDTKFNNPGFQAYRDNVLFTAIDTKAYVATNGSVSIEALAQDQELDLNLANINFGTYYLGTTNTNYKATYSSNFGGIQLLYRTDVISGPVAKIASPLVSGGTGYTAANAVPTTSTGVGLGLTVKTMVNTSGVISSVEISSPGNNYKSGDIITVTGGGNNAKFKILNVEGSNGEITITENTGGTISGNFKFNAANANGNPDGGNQVNFQYGTFYKIPIYPAP